MRTSFVLLALAAISGNCFAANLKFGHQLNLESAIPKHVRIFEDTINETLECIRYTLVTGLPEYDIPSVESVTLDEFNLNLEDFNLNGYSGFFNVANLLLEGLTSFYASDIKGDLALLPLGYKLDIIIVFQNIDISLLYGTDMFVDGMPIYGDGGISWKMTDISFKIHVLVNLSDGVQLEDLSILINIGSSTVDVTGWFNDDEHSQIFTDLINDYLIPAWVNQQPESIDEFISPIIQDYVNSLLASKILKSTREGILDAIAANCENQEGSAKLTL